MTLRLSRRTALGAIGAGLLAGCVSPRLAAPLRRPLGLADITLRRELTRDYAGTLAKVAAMGFTHFGFRLADPMPGSSEPPARDKAAMVRDAGLEMGPVRFNPRGPNPSREIAIAAEIGASIIALTTAPVFISGGAIGKTTLPEFEAWLPQLIALDEEARAAGLTLATPGIMPRSMARRRWSGSRRRPMCASRSIAPGPGSAASPRWRWSKSWGLASSRCI
jgi:hypothetical protein